MVKVIGCRSLFYGDFEAESVEASSHTVHTSSNTQAKQLALIKRVRDFFRFFGTDIPFCGESAESFHIRVAVLTFPDSGRYAFRCFFCWEAFVAIKQVECSCCLPSTNADIQRKRATVFKRCGVNLYDGVVLMRDHSGLKSVHYLHRRTLGGQCDSIQTGAFSF